MGILFVIFPLLVYEHMCIPLSKGYSQDGMMQWAEMRLLNCYIQSKMDSKLFSLKGTNQYWVPIYHKNLKQEKVFFPSRKNNKSKQDQQQWKFHLLKQFKKLAASF